MFTMQATANGYAYSRSGATQIAAICVLLAYVLLALAHASYSAWTGWYSGCWDTATEIAVLALNSEPTTIIKNTGAGIRTVGTLEEPINIVAKDGRLVMLPTHDKYSGERIRNGYAYG